MSSSGNDDNDGGVDGTSYCRLACKIMYECKKVCLKFEHIGRIDDLNTPYSSHKIEFELQGAWMDAGG